MTTAEHLERIIAKSSDIAARTGQTVWVALEYREWPCIHTMLFERPSEDDFADRHEILPDGTVTLI